MNLSSDTLISILIAYIFPFFRIGALIMVAPIFSTKIVPVRIKIGLSILITILVVPLLPTMPLVDPVSAEGLLVAAYQILIGLSVGFAIRIVFSALETGGQMIAQTMGLGFAEMVDPSNGVTVPVVSQFYTVMATLLFLTMNGHLVMIELLVESFRTLPIVAGQYSVDFIWLLVEWSSWIFKGAVIIAVPAVTALLLVNVAFGVMMRAAPQLNIFAVGFPLSLTLGFVFIFVTLPLFIPQFENLLEMSFGTAFKMINF